MGPACHPLCTIQLSFLGFFLAPHIWSLDFFFRSPAASQTVIPLLLNGTRMSSSMYYKTFFSWIIFGSSYLVTWLFLSIPCRLSNGETAAAKWDPHVILYEQSTFFSWSFFWHLIFGHLPFSFDLMPRLKRWGTCWLMGPTCHPLCAIKVSFVGFFFTLWFLACLFLLIPCPLWNVE